MRYGVIQKHREAFPVTVLCQVLEVSTSGFYAWLRRPESPRSQTNRRLLVESKAVYHRRRHTYGSPCVPAALNAQGHACGKHRVAQLMRTHGIGSRPKRKFKATTNSRHTHPVAEHLLQRQFTVAAPNRGWVSDITYIPTQEGWLYLAVTLDLYHRKVIGWAMDRWMTQQRVIDACTMALKNGRPGQGLSHHSDQGVQYACKAFQALLKAAGIQCSMSRKGHCWDNAVAASFSTPLRWNSFILGPMPPGRRPERRSLTISKSLTTGSDAIPLSAI